MKDKIKKILNLTLTQKTNLIKLHKKNSQMTHYDDWWGKYWMCGCQFTQESSFNCPLHSILDLLEIKYERDKPTETTPSHTGMHRKKCDVAQCPHCEYPVCVVCWETMSTNDKMHNQCIEEWTLCENQDDCDHDHSPK